MSERVSLEPRHPAPLVQPELRLLILGHSGDLIEFGPELGSRVTQLQQAVAALTRRPVHARWAAAYPTPSLSRHVTRLLDTFDPDILILHTTAYLVATTSLGPSLQAAFGGRLDLIPQRLLPAIRRRLDLWPGEGGTRGTIPVPPQLREAGQALYRAGRNALLCMGLGHALASVDMVADAYEAAIALMASREPVTVVVRGPSPQRLPGYPVRTNHVGMAQIGTLDERLREACAHRRVPFISTRARMGADFARYLLPDGVHTNAEGHVLTVELDLELLRPLLT